MVVDLAESRAKIDVIDREIVRLFQERMGVATDVAAYKRSTGKKVFDPKREEEKLEALRAMAEGEFNKISVEDLFRQIMSISRKLEWETEILCLLSPMTVQDIKAGRDRKILRKRFRGS